MKVLNIFRFLSGPVRTTTPERLLKLPCTRTVTITCYHLHMCKGYTDALMIRKMHIRNEGIIMTLSFVSAQLVMHFTLSVWNKKTSIVLIPHWSMLSLRAAVLCSFIFSFSQKWSSWAGHSQMCEQKASQMKKRPVSGGTEYSIS